MCELMCHL